MSTSFAQIQAALLAALNSAPALAGGRINVNYLRPIPAAHSTALVLRLAQSEGNEQVLGALDWSSHFIVECYARAAAGADPSAAVDALLSDAWQRLSGLSEAAVGANLTLQPLIEREYDLADTPVICAAIHLTAQHRTPLSTLQPWN